MSPWTDSVLTRYSKRSKRWDIDRLVGGPAMPAPAKGGRYVRFGSFEVDLKLRELRMDGRKVKLQDQPYRILAILLEQPGELVTREELRRRLWPAGTFVDFEHSVNTAVKKLRQALGDDPENPHYIETSPRHGYRFIAPVAPAYDPRADSAIRDRRYSTRRVALGITVLVVAAVAIVVGLNVGGLRDRLMPLVGASVSRPSVPAPKIESLAVLPLANLSGDPEQEYFADGMTDALIAELGQIASLRVISRTSVMQYKGVKRPLPQIAKELNVDALIEGSVLRAGERVRVTAQLIGAAPERHLWARNYERDLRDVLTLQGEVARAIADEIRANVTPDVQTRLARSRPVDPEAHELYLKGIRLRSAARDIEAWSRVKDFFQQAIGTHPSYAPAYAALASWYNNAGEDNYLPRAEAFSKAKALALRTLAADHNLAEAHVALAFALMYLDWDWAAADRESRRALELNPNSTQVLLRRSFYLSLMGRAGEAVREVKRALELDPLRPDPYFPLAFAYYWGHQYDQALEALRMGQEINPKWDPPWVRGWALREKGKHAAAIAVFETMESRPGPWGHLGNTYARAGKRAEAQQMILKLKEGIQRGKKGTYEIALIYAGLGEKDQAFEWLEEAYEAHDTGMCFLKVDPPLDPLRSDPRFQDLLRRMNFPP